MARFVSPHRNYSHGVRAGSESHLGPDGKMVPETRYLEAIFSPDLRSDAERDLALSTFTFRGTAIYENGQPVDPTYRISVFDSEIAAMQNGWTDEEHAVVLDELRNHGPNGMMYVEVIPVPAEKPWNGYDELTDADRIVDLATGIGADLSKVIAYEAATLNREDVIDALNIAIGDAAETTIVRA